LPWDKKSQDPATLWKTLANRFKPNLHAELERLTQCKLVNFRGSEDWVAEQDRIWANIDLCSGEEKIDGPIRCFFLLSNLPKTPEWEWFKTTLDILVKGRYEPEIVIDKLRAFECSYRRKNGIHQDAPLFSEKKKNRGGKNTR
jgi:hypothetical protein